MPLPAIACMQGPSPSSYCNASFSTTYSSVAARVSTVPSRRTTEMPTWLKPGTVSQAAYTMASSVSWTVGRESIKRIAEARAAVVGGSCAVGTVYSPIWPTIRSIEATRAPFRPRCFDSTPLRHRLTVPDACQSRCGVRGLPSERRADEWSLGAHPETLKAFAELARHGSTDL